MRQLCKSETKSRARITVKKFSQPHKCLYQAMPIGEKSYVFYCFYKLTFPRQNAKFFVMALIKRKILTSHPVLYTKSCMRIISSCFAKKTLCKTWIFSRLKRQLKRKKLTQHDCKDFPSFSRRGNG